MVVNSLIMGVSFKTRWGSYLVWTEYTFTKDNKFDILEVRFRSLPWRQDVLKKLFFSLLNLLWLAHKRQQKDIRARRMAYLTQFSVPTLLNPMINKMADEASAILLLICSHEAWGKVAYTGPRPCAYACAYVDPVFTCQSYDMGISTRRTNFVVRFTCAYAYALCRPSFHLLTHVLVPMLMLMR